TSAAPPQSGTRSSTNSLARCKNEWTVFSGHPAKSTPAARTVAELAESSGKPDGSLVYRVVFDVRDYEPGDLKTSLVGDRTVRVCGNSKRVDPRTAQAELRLFSLPDGVDPSRCPVHCGRGQLSVTAPVMPPQYSGKQPALQQQSRGRVRLPSPSLSLAPTSAQGSRQQGGVRTASAFQLEVDSPTVDNGRRLSVHGRREVKSAGKNVNAGIPRRVRLCQPMWTPGW
uniref:SHSP domain-containing protein n=1 Tax=Macrostomum lignano TaxID=282301 RepID=A0A1I8FLG5_9PLAT